MESVEELQLDMNCVSRVDQQMVRDVAVVMSTVCKVAGRKLQDISIVAHGQIYHITAMFAKGCVVEISKNELETITDVNPLRVVSTSVLYDGECMHIKARVCSVDHPVTVTDTSIVKIVKKRRWGLGF